MTISALTAGTLLGSIGLKFWMSRFNRELGKRIGSSALLATGADSRNDCVATAAVLAAALIEGMLDLRVDGIFGLGIAVFVLLSGWSLAKDTISPLLGENADPELRSKIVDYIERQPKVLGFHDLMVHDYGPGQRFATLHVEMDHREDPLECHDRQPGQAPAPGREAHPHGQGVHAETGEDPADQQGCRRITGESPETMRTECGNTLFFPAPPGSFLR